MSNPTTLADISAASHGERFQHRLADFAGKDHAKRLQCYDLAWQAATEEMLDEMHAMLRHLTGVKSDG